MTLLHIGLPKTGTTSLQLNLFDRHPEIFLIGNRDLQNHGAASYSPVMTERLLDPIRNQDSLDYVQAEVGAARDELLARCGDDQRVVVSDEFLTVTFDPKWRLTDRRLVAERLATTFPDACVLITIRSQLSMLGSVYGQVARGGKERHGRLPPFPEWVRRELCSTTTGVMSMLAYDRLHHLYADVFGPERVTVLAFEDLVASSDGFARTVCELAQVDPDLGVQLLRRGVTRRAPNRLQVRLARASTGGHRVASLLRTVRDNVPEQVKDMVRRLPAAALDTTLDDELVAAVMERFDASNRRLAASTGLDLNALGYFERPGSASSV